MEEILNKKKIYLDCHLHWNMAFVGGMFGAYALLNRMDTFGSSVTSNFIYIVMNLLGRDWQAFALRFMAVAIYALGLFITVFVPKITKLDMRYCSILVDTAAVLIIAQFPADMNFLVGLYPILFATAFQWCVYAGAKGYNCSSIFSTNNLKQTMLGFGNYIVTGDEAYLDKAKFFGTTLIYFHLGVILCWFSCHFFAIKGAYAILIPLFFAFMKARKRVAIREADLS